jgi:uncharacterized protein with PQ loop repeat
MLRWFDRTPDAAWEHLGVFAGAVSCVTIGYQVFHEWRTAGPSSVSIGFVAGFFGIYVFWFLYGVRFRRRGIWLSNSVAAILQLLFAMVVLGKP